MGIDRSSLTNSNWHFVVIVVASVGPVGHAWAWPDFDKGQRWSIQCLEFQGAQARSNCEGVAGVLKKADGLQAKRVFCFHEEQRSLLMYGEYYRKTDKKTGKLSIPGELTRDVDLLKSLIDDQGRRMFLGARMVPYPTPNVGDPKFDLRNVQADFTLQVAVFYDTDDFHERKQGAADYAALLRSKGFEAYYYHGESSSDVTVGAFHRDPQELAPGQKPSFTPQIDALLKDELLMHYLENGRKVYRLQGGQREPLVPRLVHVPQSDAEPWW